MPTETVVRDLRREDLDALLALYREHLHANDDPLPERREVEAIWDGLLRDPSQIYLGGFADGALVSASNAAVIANLTRGARPYAVIENVVTDARYRRQGIGSKVIRALLERCWAQRCYKVMLMSGMVRSEIHGFYESLGFDRNAKAAFVITAR
jgi:GNAT superfamily N-acetyltransferase